MLSVWVSEFNRNAIVQSVLRHKLRAASAQAILVMEPSTAARGKHVAATAANDPPRAACVSALLDLSPVGGTYFVTVTSLNEPGWTWSLN